MRPLSGYLTGQSWRFGRCFDKLLGLFYKKSRFSEKFPAKYLRNKQIIIIFVVSIKQ